MTIPGVDSPELPAWLRARALEAIERMDALGRTMASDRYESDRRLHELTREFRSEVRDAIARSEGAYRGWRLIGFMLAMIGVTVTLIASLMAT